MSKKLGWGLLVASLLFLSIKTPVIRADTIVPEVIINEMAWAGSSVSSADEWIELKNITDADIDIAGWQIKRLDTSGQQEIPMLVISVDQNHIIPAMGYFLIANNGKDYQFSGGQSVLNIDPDYTDTAVSILDNPFKVLLYDSTEQLIDSAGDGGKGSDFCGIKGIAMERNAEFGAGDLSNSWHEATKATNLDDGVIDKGTPKAENSLPAAAAPKINKIIPDQAKMDTIWEIEEIIGENFTTTDVTQIKLEKDGSAVWATEVKVMNPISIDTAKFDLHEAEAGEWDVVVINPDGQSGTLPNAVEILEPEEETENPVYSNDVMLSELYPHPATGGEEFIELYNSGDNSVNLKGWKLDDQSPGGSAEYTVPTDIIISPQQYLIFPKSQTHIYLNDIGDYARLLQPNGILLDSAPNYGTAAAGYAYAKINSNWQWTKRVTPNAANIYESIAEEEDNSAATDLDPNSLQPNEITIQLESDDIASTTITLIWKINLPGALGDIKIYQSDKKNVPGVEIGKTDIQHTEYAIKNLLPKTKYFFTVVGSYNASDIKSNQIEITTTSTKTTTGNGSKGVLKQIIINEILPNPNAGDNEFIEIYNPTDQDIDIAGWKLQDASGKTYIISVLDLEDLMIADEDTDTAVILEPNQYLLLEYPTTHIRLNNSGGEEVQLLDGEDNLVDKVDYAGSAKQGYAYVLAPNSQWFWSNETTPGEANDISFASMDEDSGAYLVDSGKPMHWPVLIWISGIISVIILSYIRKYGHSSLYHK